MARRSASLSLRIALGDVEHRLAVAGGALKHRLPVIGDVSALVRRIGAETLGQLEHRLPVAGDLGAPCPDVVAKPPDVFPNVILGALDGRRDLAPERVDLLGYAGRLQGWQLVPPL